MAQRLDIAIVGAGPAGLAAALFLHRAGHRVTIFERFGAAKPLGSGLILQPTGLSVLGALGLFDEIAALGSRIDRLFGADSVSGRAVLDVRYDAQKKGRFGVAVHRAALFGVLHRAVEAEGIAIVTGVDVDALGVGSGRATLIGPEARAIGSFDLVVDASGSRSKLAAFARQAPRRRDLSYGAFWATLGWAGGDDFDPHALVQRYQRASVMIGVLPIGRDRPDGREQAAFFWSLKSNDAEAVIRGGLDAWKTRVAGFWPAVAPYLDQIESFDQLTLARYGHHTLKVPAGPRLAIIGDAAHSTSPQLGQGANMALLDAAALAHAVDTSADVATALDAYVRSRRRHVRIFQALSAAFTPFYQSDSVLLPFVRDRIVATVAKVPPAPQLLAAMVAGTIVDPFSRIGIAETDWQRLETVRSCDMAVSTL
ncbi:NAD(P)/FAD-dependent oxidoreductase [Mesorhizobium sp. CAU 1732]|uniref:FAD-dependent oxidoreductase n=1 Tax=Mesorhizobium sp. CAU 1732 TaxID=3140358 RepID=UPI0032602C1C